MGVIIVMKYHISSSLTTMEAFFCIYMQCRICIAQLPKYHAMYLDLKYSIHPN